MKNSIKKVINLFGENEIEVEWWDLRERARPKMHHDDWVDGFHAAMKTSVVDYDKGTSIVKLNPCDCAIQCNEKNNCRHLPKYNAP
jgi:hypothetical protein